MDETIEIKTKITLTDKNITDLLSCALESGITYWADDLQVVGEYKGKDEYEHFLNNGILAIHITEGPIEEDGPEWYEIDKEKFVKGLKQYLENPNRPYNILEENDDHSIEIDTSEADSEVCDMIVQYALFGEIVFG